MASILGGLIASIGMALVITALVQKGSQTTSVVNASANGLANLMHASLGYA